MKDNCGKLQRMNEQKKTLSKPKTKIYISIEHLLETFETLTIKARLETYDWSDQQRKFAT